MSLGSSKTPAAPDPAKSYEQGIQAYLKYLPQQLQAEADARGQYDPARVAQQQWLQQTFGPTQYGQQLDSLAQLDPESMAIRGQLAQSVSGDLAGGYRLPEEYANELTSNFRGGQAARGNILGTGAGAAEAAFKGKAALDLYQQHLSNAGAFLSGPTPESQIAQIQAVQPDRSSAYTNPAAGYAGQNFALQNYQNLLAQNQLSGQGRNPWASALGGAETGAKVGSAAGGWGSLIGGVVGGAAGYFSSRALKENIELIDVSDMGIPVVEFNYRSDPAKVRYRGVLAEDVAKIKPEAVIDDNSGYQKVLYDMIDVPFVRMEVA